MYEAVTSILTKFGPGFIASILPSSKTISKLNEIADWCERLGNSLAENPASTLTPKRTVYEDSLNKLKHCLDGYGGQCLDKVASLRVTAELRAIKDALSDLTALRTHEQIHVQSVVRSEQEIAEKLKGCASQLRISGSKKQSVRRKLVIWAPLAFFFASGGAGGLYLLEKSQRSAKARTKFMKDSIQSMDPPYRTDTFENGTLPPSHFFAGGILPSTHHLVADREFLAVNFDVTEPAERYANGERLAGVEAAVAKLHTILATNPPIVVVTGRVGGGMGYVPAHLFARLLEDSLEENQKDATFAGHKRWVFSIDLSQLPHLTETNKGPVAGLRLLLLEKARNQVAADALSDDAILTNAIVIFMGPPVPALDKLLPKYAAAAKDWGTTLVAMLPIETFERGSSPDFRRGWGLELMEYKDDEKTRQHLATIAVTQFLKRRVDAKLKNHNKNDIMNATAMVLMDPLAVQLITSNWRISSRYMDARFESAADLKAVKSISPVESIAIARKATANAINVYAKDWLQKIVMRSKPTHERVSAQLIKSVLVRAGSMGSFIDDDCDAMIVAAGIASAGSDDVEAVRLLLKGSPFFKADSKGRLAWIPFTTDVGSLL